MTVCQTDAELSQEVATAQDDDERPAKKQKIAKAEAAPSNVIKLAISPTQQHAVVVTEDKCVRVFSVAGNGAIEELSQRFMPKRPCAVEVLPDGSSILCGDKFGDVYSIPLLIAKPAEDVDAAIGANGIHEVVEKKGTFKPSASTSTVHSKRNRKALEAQMAQRNFTPRKEALQFEHKLLLGHVSMLTDMVFATTQVDGVARPHIITADRDEHIRISRGPPQAHIIEGYCMGHTEFISSLCLVPGTDLLVSGGGDDWLGVWSWPKFELLRKIDLRASLNRLLSEKLQSSLARAVADGKLKLGASGELPIVVSGITVAPLTARAGTGRCLLVTLEKMPLLFAISLEQALGSSTTDLTYNMMDMGGIPVAITYVEDSVIISFDTRQHALGRLHAYWLIEQGSPGSDSARQAEQIRLAKFCSLEGIIGYANEGLAKRINALAVASSPATDDKKLDALLYNTGSLRKRRGWEDADDAGEDADAVEAEE